MAGVQRQRIKSLYGEIAGILEQLPPEKESSVVDLQVADQYNTAVRELSENSDTDYSRFELRPTDQVNERYYQTTVIRTRIGSLVQRLKEEYSFGLSATNSSSPVVVTVQQNQSLSVAVVPIQQLIADVDNQELRKHLEELKQAAEHEKNPSRVSTILNQIMNKSWELFIKVLPYVLEHMGNSNTAH